MVFASLSLHSCPNSSARFDGETYETGRLHRLLEKATDPVMKMYVADLRNTELKLEDGANTKGTPALTASSSSCANDGSYMVDIPSYEDSTFQGITYILNLTDPKNNRWTIRKKYQDFEVLHKTLSSNLEELRHSPSSPPIAMLPGKFTSLIRPTKTEIEERVKGLQSYLTDILQEVASLSEDNHKVLCEFLDVKVLYDPPTKIVHAENIPNHFLVLKQQLTEYRTSSEANAQPADRMILVLKQIWGGEISVKILEAHALLQRMATLLGMTLEINHFFVSMFGNTLAFAKLPLRDLLLTLKDILGNFSAVAQELFRHACQINADQKYNWHKNLQTTEHGK